MPRRPRLCNATCEVQGCNMLLPAGNSERLMGDGDRACFLCLALTPLDTGDLWRECSRCPRQFWGIRKSCRHCRALINSGSEVRHATVRAEHDANNSQHDWQSNTDERQRLNQAIRTVYRRSRTIRVRIMKLRKQMRVNSEALLQSKEERRRLRRMLHRLEKIPCQDGEEFGPADDKVQTGHNFDDEGIQGYQDLDSEVSSCMLEFSHDYNILLGRNFSQPHLV